jgi:hypothetical protein
MLDCYYVIVSSFFGFRLYLTESSVTITRPITLMYVDFHVKCQFFLPEFN